MRALNEPFVYRITTIREPHPIFRFIMTQGPVAEREAYATFNMGVGFAVYVEPSHAAKCLQIAIESGYTAWQAGVVEEKMRTAKR